MYLKMVELEINRIDEVFPTTTRECAPLTYIWGRCRGPHSSHTHSMAPKRMLVIMVLPYPLGNSTQYPCHGELPIQPPPVYL